MKNQTKRLVVILLVVACFGLLSGAQALSPAPDGCYPNFTTAEGCNALAGLGTGAGNTGLGWKALLSDSSGSFNTAVGAGALIFSNGDSNTALGAAALLLDSTGSNNTAVGTGTLVNNLADGNTATGAFALSDNTTGGTLETINDLPVGPNTAVGSGALQSNLDGSANTAVGYNALFREVHGVDVIPQIAANTAVGFEAIASATGSGTTQNIANTALGYRALLELTDGVGNIAVGFQAGANLSSGENNIFIGVNQDPATQSENFHTYIGNIGLTPLPVGGNVDVVTINTLTNLLGVNSSSRRYKEDIKSMDKASDALYLLKPVSYRLKKEVDKHQSRAFGLIAEEVAEVNPDLIMRNAQGQVEGVHYEMVNAMLLNEFLKEHRAFLEGQRKVERLEKQVAALAAGLQKVSAQLDLNNSAPQTVLHNQ